MLEYFRLEGLAYNMANVAETTATLARVGFVEIEARDRNAWYRDLARRELAALEGELRPLVAERIGALTDSFLGRDRPMGESRALWEIGSDGIEVRRLRARLRSRAPARISIER